MLSKFLIRWMVTAIAVAGAAWLVPGIRIEEPHRIWTVLLAALVLGLLNAFIRPILRALSCGLIVLTLGLFTLVLNALLLWLASRILVNWLNLGFHVEGFWNAVLGALIISVISVLLSLFVGGGKSK